MKRKKILLGSIFVLALILLMPSIPAIQQKTIEDKAYSDFVEELKYNNGLNDRIKLQILYLFVMLILNNRWNRSGRIADFAIDVYYNGDYPEINVKHPILLIYAFWLLAGCEFWIRIWSSFSDKLNLGWTFEIPETLIME